ncbi:hypothetical protein O0L34_g11942 [Tuta absoluta]|nr:hypothetical protein O0L34_g11942 [Tuta absoluta]
MMCSNRSVTSLACRTIGECGWLLCLPAAALSASAAGCCVYLMMCSSRSVTSLACRTIGECGWLLCLPAAALSASAAGCCVYLLPHYRRVRLVAVFTCCRTIGECGWLLCLPDDVQQ